MSDYSKVQFNNINFNRLKRGDKLVDGDGRKRLVKEVYNQRDYGNPAVKIANERKHAQNEHRYVKYNDVKATFQAILKKR